VETDSSCPHANAPDSSNDESTTWILVVETDSSIVDSSGRDHFDHQSLLPFCRPGRLPLPCSSATPSPLVHDGCSPFPPGGDAALGPTNCCCLLRPPRSQRSPRSPPAVVEGAGVSLEGCSLAAETAARPCCQNKQPVLSGLQNGNRSCLADKMAAGLVWLTKWQPVLSG
jgi:hypothetical protein